jgi:preprotein translocase subunit SecF
MELFKNANFDFLGKKWPFIIASVVLTVAGIVSLVAKGGPEYGIDFKGGALMYVKFLQPPDAQKIRAALQNKIPGEIVVQDVAGEQEVMISTEMAAERSLEQARRTMIETLTSTFGQSNGKIDLNNTGQAALADRLRGPLQSAAVALSEQQLQQLSQALLSFRDSAPRSGLIRSMDDLASVPGVTPQVLTVLKQQAYAAPFAIRNVEVVGPKVGSELKRQAVLATLGALAGMLVYIAFRFEWIYGVAAVLAVFHDTIITIGLFSIFDKEISLTVVAALLTLVGYSMNDTIVVFDRIRENLKVLRREPYESIVNKSINQTLSRTVLTSGLTFVTALALLLFGGPVLNGFAFALVVGIIVGTYSSIFIASPILVWWQGAVESRKRRTIAVPAAKEGIRRSNPKAVK